MTEKMFLNVSEAAELLGVNKITMYKYIREKAIPAVKIGNKTWKIPRKSLDMMVEEIVSANQSPNTPKMEPDKTSDSK